MDEPGDEDGREGRWGADERVESGAQGVVAFLPRRLQSARISRADLRARSDPQRGPRAAMDTRPDELTVEAFMGQLASSAPTPGGGSAAALAGAMGAALVHMVVELTTGRPDAGPVEDELRDLALAAAGFQSELLQFVENDAAAYASAAPEELWPYIRTLGLYRTKAKAIVAAMLYFSLRSRRSPGHVRVRPDPFARRLPRPRRRALRGPGADPVAGRAPGRRRPHDRHVRPDGPGPGLGPGAGETGLPVDRADRAGSDRPS